ncbi:MAG: substrate-binding domain-containing protein [Treponema sp.]|nr:substrate-binding domain-containing protein [Treponema sp.]
MPAAAADGIIKIAVLVNSTPGENVQQFIEGSVSEGRSMGFTVDIFFSGGDEERCREMARGIAHADYDGLIFSYGNAGFSYDILRPIADSGIKIVTFETLPYRDGRSIHGLVTTFQDDYSLARLSLETLVSYSRPDHVPRVIRISSDSDVIFLDRRAWVFNELVNKGIIEEVALILLPGLENPYSAAQEALAEILPRFLPGSADAVWVPWNEFARGAVGALASAGREDIKLFSVGISGEDIHQMLHYPDIWLASAATDTRLAGTVTMRILAAALAGEPLEETFYFSPQLVNAADLNFGVHISNFSVMLPGWGDGTGLFDHYPWMVELHTAAERYLRIAPVVETAAAP